jgi:FkbM family methyltransferase
MNAATRSNRTTTPAGDWRLATASGSVLLVPPTTTSLTTFVLLEQEGWFEPEMAWLPRWLQPGMQVLDIGANHGVYTVEIARAIGEAGHVWAFEPTQVPRGRLLGSVAANGLQQRVTVVPAGLADANGTARFLVQHNSELNARDANMAAAAPTAQHEEVQLLALDPYLASAAPGVKFDFVKLDAEGDELRVIEGAREFFAAQSPVVMFEFMHGASQNPALVRRFRELGFGIFKLAADVGVLLPFDELGGNTGFALNLFAVRPAQQQALAQAGLLLLPGALETEGAVRRDPAALADWCARPGLRGAQGDAPAVPDTQRALSAYDDALWAVAAAHRQAGLSAAQRVALLIDARERILAALNHGQESSPEAWLLLAHSFWALGEPVAALQLGAQLLQQWSAADAEATVIERAVVPPQRSDLERRRSTPLGPWLRQCLAEWVATRSAWSAYFEQPAPQRWAALLAHPDHGNEIERRYLLANAASGSTADLGLVTRLAEPGATSNPGLWSQVLASFAAAGHAAAAEPAAVPAAARSPKHAPSTPDTWAAGASQMLAAAALGPADVLAALAPETVDVVDVGASSHGPGTAPWSVLLVRGHARVTAFEPDAAACAELQAEADGWAGRGHRVLPHFVGDGGAATFHETAWHMTGSLLSANTELLAHYHLLAESTAPRGRHAVQTVRLDDVLPPGGLDLLKIDVQGAEMQVFDGAARLLDECLVVWTEVAFVPIYRDQPLFGDVAARMARHGLMFHAFSDTSANVRHAWAVKGTPMPLRPQAMWSDAIFVPTPERLARLSASGAARLALIAHHTIGAWDLCHAALERHDAIKGGRLAPAYQQAWIARTGAGR